MTLTSLKKHAGGIISALIGSLLIGGFVWWNQTDGDNKVRDNNSFHFTNQIKENKKLSRENRDMLNVRVGFMEKTNGSVSRIENEMREINNQIRQVNASVSRIEGTLEMLKSHLAAVVITKPDQVASNGYGEENENITKRH